MRYQRVIVLIVIGWYLILAMGHYFDRRPLWNDEQCVLDNIIHLKPGPLFTRPLLSDQAFPRLYLWGIQQFFRLSYKGEASQGLLLLRLFPLMAMMGAFFVWFKIARQVLNQSWDLVLFTGCWCASIPLVYHAAELKPYSMDVLSSGLIVLFLINADQIKKNPSAYRAILFSLPWLGLLSYPAIFLLLLPLYNLARECLNGRRWLPEMSYYLGGCILTLGFVYLFDFRVSLPHLLEVFWHDYFISVDSLKGFLNSFGKGMNNLISRQFAEDPRWAKIPSRIFIGWGIVYMLAAFWGQFERDCFVLRSIVPITFSMFLIQLALAVWRVYPFAVPRMSLFFFPLLLLMTVMASSVACRRFKALGIIFRFFFAGYLIFVSMGIAWDVFIKGDLGAQSMLYSPR